MMEYTLSHTERVRENYGTLQKTVRCHHQCFFFYLNDALIYNLPTKQFIKNHIRNISHQCGILYVGASYAFTSLK